MLRREGGGEEEGERKRDRRWDRVKGRRGERTANGGKELEMAKGRKEDIKGKNKGEGDRAKERKEDMMVKRTDKRPKRATCMQSFRNFNTF